jgi:alkanesulfonate monooxygenase SsuD/methylene tetrahydromethanopterin reductase-like flavin-dependent oxidoreductase (luciferase family)
LLANDLKNFFHVKQKIEDMRLSLGLTTSMPLKESLPLARLAEEKGYSRIWVGEDITGGDVFAYLSVLAAETERISLGTGITSVFLRNLAVIANSSAGLQVISQGRFCLGLGAGGIPEITEILGHRPRNVVSEMESAVAFLRRVLAGGEAGITTGYTRIKGFSLAVSPGAPRVYLGVRGSKMLALAGRIADGVIFSGPRGYLGEALDIVNTAAEDAGRDPDELDKVLWNPFVLAENRKDFELAAGMVKVMLPSMPPAAEKYLTDDPAQSLCTCGDIGEIRSRLKEYSSLGFSEVVVGPPYGSEPATVINTLGESYGIRH